LVPTRPSPQRRSRPMKCRYRTQPDRHRNHSRLRRTPRRRRPPVAGPRGLSTSHGARGTTRRHAGGSLLLPALADVSHVASHTLGRVRASRIVHLAARKRPDSQMKGCGKAECSSEVGGTGLSFIWNTGWAAPAARPQIRPTDLSPGRCSR
jgi:hypothetical protein